MILVLTNSADATADYLVSKFVEANVPHVRLDSDKAAQSCAVRSNVRETLLSIDSRAIRPADIRSIWYRRPKPIQIRTAESRERALHAEGEWSEAIEGFLAQVPKRNWINHPADCALASHKIEQLARASGFGLNIPDTLVTQSIKDLTEFYHRHGGRLICKPMSSGLIEESDNRFIVYTSAVRDSDLEEGGLLSKCPTLFQERLDKKLDIRITWVDGRPVAAGLLAREFDKTQRVDIRRNNMTDVLYGQIDIPENIEAKLGAYIRSYGLRFAAIDMAITQTGDWVFFEVNPNGQWAWLDQSGATDISSCMIEALCSSGEEND